MTSSARKINERTAIWALLLSLFVNPGWFSVFDVPAGGVEYSATLIVFCGCVGLAAGAMLRWWGEWGPSRLIVLVLIVASLCFAMLAPALKSSLSGAV